MRCTAPRTVGFRPDGKTICWSPKQRSKEYASFQLPCGKCLECRLEYARQWAVRCVHESMVHPKNSFITLTYADEHLGDNRLDYADFQKFMKKLRKLQQEPVGFFVTGEYGEKSKRKHWHAIVFNFRPLDAQYLRTTDRGDKVFSSELLDRTWSLGRTELGDVTFESAGYCARYAAKKLVHGKDHEHEFQPISKKSNKRAIGKAWLEKFWPDIFEYGELRLIKNGQTITTGIPRYYEKWLKEHHPERWVTYVTQAKQTKIDYAQNLAKREATDLERASAARSELAARTGIFRGGPTSRVEARKEILRSKFKLLQSNLKL